MPLIDTGLVRVIVCDAKGGQEGLEFQEPRILPGAYHISKHSPRVVIKRVPELRRTLFGTDEAPHFIHFGLASWLDATLAVAGLERL